MTPNIGDKVLWMFSSCVHIKKVIDHCDHLAVNILTVMASGEQNQVPSIRKKDDKNRRKEEKLEAVVYVW